MNRHHRISGFRLLAVIAAALLAAACEQRSGENSEQVSTAPGAEPPTAQGPKEGGGSPPPAAPGTIPQAPTPAVQPGVPPAGQAQPLTNIESLVAPIALYPDPLLAELLVASTYPLEVVQAARWLESKPDPTTLRTKDWDASVMRLTEVPSVIKMMSDHLEWTTQLGDAFLAKPEEVMDTIQALRKRAMDSGFLKDSPEQKVVTKTISAPAQEEAVTPEGEAVESATGGTVKATPAVFQREVISIEPAKSDTIYVPQYNPQAVYSAPLAPPPTTGAAYPATTAGYTYPAAPAPSYYPTYYPTTPTATTTASDYSPALTFGAGAVVGGLLTWGIMELADDDDDWQGYYIGHPYGGAVCHDGECWRGGGYYGAGGYRGDVNIDRGDISVNRDVNISGNEITVNRDRTFKQSDLASIRQPTAWVHDPRHRRGQRYPEEAKKRLGDVRQPALAGQRLGAAQTLPAEQRGFTRPGTLAAERRPSSDEIRERLARQPGAADRPRVRPAEQRPSRENALEGLRSSGQQARIESRRGSESRKIAKAESRGIRHREPAAQRRPEGAAGQRLNREQKRTERARQLGGRERQQQIDRQRRAESARPNAFEGSRNARRTQSFSQRGATSRQRVASAGHPRKVGGEGHRGGGGRRGGGGHRR